MTDRFVTVPDSLELPAAVKVPVARLSDSTAAGRALLTGADAAAQRTSLGLGDAAQHAHGDYATAEQGGKADSAVQPAALDALAPLGSLPTPAGAYATSPDLYPDTDTGTAAEVQQWCLEAPAHLRIVLAGYDGDHTVLEAHGWRVTQGLPGRGSGYSTNPGAGLAIYGTGPIQTWIGSIVVHNDPSQIVSVAKRPRQRASHTRQPGGAQRVLLQYLPVHEREGDGDQHGHVGLVLAVAAHLHGEVGAAGALKLLFFRICCELDRDESRFIFE